MSIIINACFTRNLSIEKIIPFNLRLKKKERKKERKKEKMNKLKIEKFKLEIKY